MTSLLLAAALAGFAPAPQLVGIHVSDGSRPFAGDRPLLTTVSPNGDGFRDRAIVSFGLTRPATVRLDVVATEAVGKPGSAVIWSTSRRFSAGSRRIRWGPA